MGIITSPKLSKRTENNGTKKTSRGPQIDSGFTKFQDQIKTIDSQEETAIY
jgi:hypothetical protein